MKVPKKYLLLILAAILFTSAFIPTSTAQPPEYWLRDYDYGGFESFRSVVATADGGHAALMVHDGEIELTKSDGFGSIEWVHAYPPINIDFPSLGTVIQTQDGGFSFRYADGESRPLVHTDRFGRVQWRVEYPELG